MQQRGTTLARHASTGRSGRHGTENVARTAGDRRPPRRRTGTVLLPPWTRAPGLGFRNPAVLMAIVAASAILACASSSAALFMSSSSSKALQRLIAARCEDAALPNVQVQVSSSYGVVSPGPFDAAAYAHLDTTAQHAFADAGLAAPERRMVSTVHSFIGNGSDPVYYYFGDRALHNVTKLASVAGAGVWLPKSLVDVFHLHLGQPVPRMGGVRLVGVYADLFGQPTRPYWCSQTKLYSQSSFDANTTNRVVLVTDPATFAELSHATLDTPTLSWLGGSDVRSHMTMTRANALISAQARAQRRIAADALSVRTVRLYGDELITRDASALPDMRARTALIRKGLAGPVVPVAIGGSVLALLLVGAAGAYWVERRFREVRLLASRGVGPVALAAKAAAELTVPALMGSVLGVGVAIELVLLVGPSSDLDPAAPWKAAATAGIAFLLGVLLIAVVAGARASALIEERRGGRRSRYGLVPWDVIVLAGAVLVYVRLRGETAIQLHDGIALVNLLLVAFPLLFLLGAAAVLLRVLAALLPLLRRLSRRLPVTWYFATNRIAAAVAVSVSLVAAAAMPVGMLVYAGTTTRTARATVDAKAALYAGSASALVTENHLQNTPALRRVGTEVVRYFGGKLGANNAEVMAIDPRTFARNAYWDSRFADRSLASLIAELSQQRADGAIPVIVIPYRYDASVGTTLHLGVTARTVHIGDVPHAFPGLHDDYSDFVVIDASRLGAVDPTVPHQFELWSAHGSAAAARILAAQHDVPLGTITQTSVIEATNYVAVSWTFAYLEALAALVGLIALGALLLYLGTRQRSRTASYALTSRMGLSRAAHRRSLLIELLVLLGTAFVLGVGLGAVTVGLTYRRLDPDPRRLPGALLTLPTSAVIGAGVGLLAAAIGGAFIAQAISDRADFASVLRTDR